ncbi:endolytic transglycosylase MltG [Bartonella harrusi]|uniref:Endolytic murein transglycosylase n=1 Tax=Bartonella harrusi TaxID=2961895 RepID=A0ABY5EUS9_9HYPH|nr:endolytic transglycosylase MltG [Bartonella harrusi]UTO29161.1 endolytic transglycosylase MltG [Bartonella harrusi]
MNDSSTGHLTENDMLAHKKQKKSSIVRNPLVILGHFFLMLMMVIILAISIPLYIGKSIFEGKGVTEEEQVVLISPGTGIRKIASLLEKRGLIRSADVFVYGVGYHQKTTHLKAGEYLIPAHASMRDIMDILVKGKSIEYTFTVPEGLTVQQVFDRLAANDILIGDLPKVLPPEGSLMTDTVRFIRGTTRKEIINRLREGQTKLIHAIWATRSPDLPIKSIEEFVILASIVEKETGIAAERSKVAAVFYNRLAKHMRLQSDPTVIYGLFGGRGIPSGRAIYRSDLEKKTPYNTYKINGLPPTAIANPGKDSLQAVAHSPSSDVLYFVADGSGGHVFSRTLEEHNENVRKWRALKTTH